jgi:hypothetical protein
MQAYQVEFVPAHLPPLRIADAIRPETSPRPHVVVGDPATPGGGTRIPLAARLLAALSSGAPLIQRVKAFRDPKSGGIVLGAESADDPQDGRALVLFSATSNFPDGVTISPGRGITTLAQGAVPHGRQLLLIWPDGETVGVDDPANEARYALRRVGDQFERIVVDSAR